MISCRHWQRCGPYYVGIRTSECHVLVPTSATTSRTSNSFVCNCCLQFHHNVGQYKVTTAAAFVNRTTTFDTGCSVGTAKLHLPAAGHTSRRSREVCEAGLRHSVHNSGADAQGNIQVTINAFSVFLTFSCCDVLLSCSVSFLLCAQRLCT